MTLKLLAAFAIGGALAGCAGTQTHMRLLEQDGTISVRPGDGQNYDYEVAIKNKVDFGFNPDDKENRNRTALLYVERECGSNATIVSESVIRTGDYLLGNEARQYFIRVKCRS